MTQSNITQKNGKGNEDRGHTAHIREAETLGLPGTMSRPIKITMLGAGSAFTPRLVNDVLRIPNNAGGSIALVDIDARRLEIMRQLVLKLLDHLAIPGWSVEATTDRREVLAGSDYVVSCIEVSGLDCVVYDNDIPLKYGVDQCIGDTIGPGGLFKALRTIPVWIEVLKDCEELCPEALVLNYTNPMSMMCLAAGRASTMNVVGLCHSVQATSKLLAEYAGVALDEMDWDCAGINHLAWFTRLRHKGEDLYPRLRDSFTSDLDLALHEYDDGLALSDASDPNGEAKRYTVTDIVRKDMCLQFGAFITESSGHLSEYLPYYRKSPEGRKFLRLGYDGGSRYYATNWPRWRQRNEDERDAILQGEKTIEWPRSWEYASWIIEGREKDSPFRFYGNVMNRQRESDSRLIGNLPADGCVEVACFSDRRGIHPVTYGPLPPAMAGVCSSNMAMFSLGAQAALDRSVETAVEALLLDPLTAAVCTPAQIRAMVLELFEAEKKWLPDYR